jgi:hypothetical protein
MRPPPVSILGQPNPVHIPTPHLLEIYPNIIHPSRPRSPPWSPSLRFPHQDPIHPLSSPICATCPAHLILRDFITRTILGEQYKSFSSSLCNLLHSTATSSLLGTNILLIFPVNSFHTPSFYRVSVLLPFVGCLVFKEYNDYVIYLYYSLYINTLVPPINPQFSFGLTVIIYE